MKFHFGINKFCQVSPTLWLLELLTRLINVSKYDIGIALNNEKYNSDGGIMPTGAADSSYDQEEPSAINFREREG